MNVFSRDWWCGFYWTEGYEDSAGRTQSRR